MTAPKFENADGSLTTYAFACGYVQTETIKSQQLRLYKDGIWHLKVWPVETKDFSERVLNSDGNLVMPGWASFETLGEARQAWRVARNLIRAGVVLNDTPLDDVITVVLENKPLHLQRFV